MSKETNYKKLMLKYKSLTERRAKEMAINNLSEEQREKLDMEAQLYVLDKRASKNYVNNTFNFNDKSLEKIMKIDDDYIIDYVVNATTGDLSLLSLRTIYATLTSMLTGEMLIFPSDYQNFTSSEMIIEINILVDGYLTDEVVDEEEFTDKETVL